MESTTGGDGPTKESAGEIWFATHVVAQKKRQEAIPDGLLNLALRAGGDPGILVDFDFDSTIFGSTFGGRVRSNRFGLAESLTRDPAALHSLLHYVIPHRHPTPIR